jgi:hypothetical protein
MSRILQCGGIEVAVVMLDELGDGAGSGHGKCESPEAKAGTFERQYTSNTKAAPVTRCGLVDDLF